MNKLAVVAFVCLCFCLAPAQEPCASPKIVKTTGTAEVKVTPDRAVIQIGVERQSATARGAKANVDSTSRKILAALKTSGVEDKDIQTAYLDLQPTSYYRKNVRMEVVRGEMREQSQNSPASAPIQCRSAVQVLVNCISLSSQ